LSSLQQFFVSIADITYAVVSADLSLRPRTNGAVQNFLVYEANPDVTIETGWDDLSATGAGSKKIFDSGAVWQLYQKDGSFLFLLYCPASGSIPYTAALMNKDYTKGRVLLHRPFFDSDQPVYPLGYPLDELLLINLLASGKGVEIHACGVIDSLGRGYLFVGQSGAGKTTVARLWQNEPGVTILSDDRIILRKADQKIWMHGTPWHGDAMLACPGKAPLTRIYFLRHGQENEILRLGKAHAISRLFACSFVPFYNPQGLDFTLRFLEEVMATIPCYELKFVPDKQAVKLLQDASD
jgi:hypothetical protein